MVRQPFREIGDFLYELREMRFLWNEARIVDFEAIFLTAHQFFNLLFAVARKGNIAARMKKNIAHCLAFPKLSPVWPVGQLDRMLFLKTFFEPLKA